MKIGIIDCGANSFHGAVYDVSSTSCYRQIYRKSYLTLLGTYLAHDGRLSSDEIERSAALVQTLCHQLRRKKVAVINVFGTSIFRSAKNSTALIDAIFKKTGILVDVLSERKEMCMIFRAVKATYQFPPSTVIVDIGGGSSELMYVKNGTIQHGNSIPWGTARILSLAPHNALPDKATIKKNVYPHYEKIIRSFRLKKIEACYVTSGFARCIALWLKGPRCLRDVHTPVILYGRDIRRATNNIHRYTGSERQAVIMYSGAMVVNYIMRALHLKAIHVTPVSSREGYLLSVFNTCKKMFI